MDYHEPIYTGYTARGERILCLDGGGIKGLILIDMLSTIEKIAGRRIVELFDWIIGTSTGGILALALVYSKCITLLHSMCRCRRVVRLHFHI